MKYSDRFFKFPIRLFNSIDFAKVEKKFDKLIEEALYEDIEKPKGVVSFQYCLPEQIVHVSPSLDLFEPIEVTINEGVNRCQVTLMNGTQHYCIWSPEKFMAKLDAFLEKEEDSVIKDFDEKINTVLESTLELFKQKYLDNNLKIELNEDGSFTIRKIKGSTRTSKIESGDTNV